jgi:hypothetical protein
MLEVTMLHASNRMMLIFVAIGLACRGSVDRHDHQ